MAKRQINKYVFTPGSIGVGSLVIPGHYTQDKLLLITNVTRGTILYNFADTANTGATVTFKPGGVKTSTADSGVVTYGRDQFGANGTAVIQRVESGLGETTIVFTGVNTSTHNANDKISVLVEETFLYTRPWNDFGTDAIERARIAAPETMIDADFEYGLQPTKWQGFQTVSTYPSIYEAVTPDLVVTGIITRYNINPVTSAATATESLISITCVGHGLLPGDPFTVSQLSVNVSGFGKAEGAFLVYGVPDNNTFTYFAKGLVGSVDGESIKDPRTQIRKGGFYSGSDLPLSYLATDGASPSVITLTFTGPHGFVPGMPILVANTNSAWGSNNTLIYLPGSYFVSNITSNVQCTFTARGAVTSFSNLNADSEGINPSAGNLITNNTAGIKVYARPDGFFTHRPGDGGVIIGTNSPIHGAGATRQSKKYFRYQSGKGFLYTTGVLFAPNYDIVAISVPGADPNASVSSNPGSEPEILITTSVPHGLQIGAVVRVRGVATTGYDGQFTVKRVESEYEITVDAISNQNLGKGVGAVSTVPKLYIYQWHGACLRTGPHDDSNGMFFEYDGNYFNVVKRTSTLQLAGTVQITNNSNRLIGTNTLWSQQLKIGDKIVVKGMVHRVTSIAGDTTISIAPDFRGVSSSSGNYIWKVEETRVSQPNFNRDTADGSGSINNPSGYKMDPNHMQMIGIQFSWYGAGFMDFMVRGQDANFIILHRMKQNNINITASMRTANLPVRYEVLNEAGSGVTGISASGAPSGIDDNDTTMPVDDASFFPPSGVVLVNNELIYYGDRNISSNPNSLTGLVRGYTANVFVGGSYRIFGGVAPRSHGTRSGVELISQTATVNMSHWGSSYIIDGGFDYDRGYQFTYTVTNANVVSAGNTIMGLRLSPSASNSTVGDLGERELLNRAQILLQSLEISCGDRRTGGNVQILVTGILNPNNYSETSQTWSALNTAGAGNQPSFSQTTANCWFSGQTYTGQTGQIASPGEKIFEFVFDPTEKQKLDLSGIKELSQSAIGGRGTFPNGADTLYINMSALPGAVTSDGLGGSTGISGANTPLRFVSNVHVTLQWGEAQA